jgi:hypothetical protein
VKHQIVNLRGCNGSGKTHAVRTFLERLPHEAIGGKPSKPKGYRVDATSWGIALPIYVVGSYENACGGLDGVPTQQECSDRIVAAHELGHVIAEGLLASKSGPNGHLMPILREHGAVFAFLDTPWDTCLERVLARRAAAGNDKPFDPEKTMRGAFKGCRRSAELLEQAGGYDVRWVNHNNIVAQVREYFLEAERG